METIILLIEDDTILREGMGELLSREGYGVLSAGSVREAETIASKEGSGKSLSQIHPLGLARTQLDHFPPHPRIKAEKNSPSGRKRAVTHNARRNKIPAGVSYSPVTGNPFSCA